MNSFLSKWGAINEVEIEINSPVEESCLERFLADIGSVSLSEFASAGYVVKLRSSLLGGQVIAFASDNANVVEDDLVTYVASELALLSAVSEDDLIRLHALKQVFGGSVIAHNTTAEFMPIKDTKLA